MSVVKDVWKKPVFRFAFVVLIVLCNIAIWIFYHQTSKQRQAGGDFGSVAEHLLQWDRQERLELSRENILAFVENVLLSQNLRVPDGVSIYPNDSVLEEQRDDLKQALVNFMIAYANNNPREIFQYLVFDRGLGDVVLLDEVKALKTELLEKNPTAVVDSEEDFFENLWKENNLGFYWEFLLAESGKFCFWKTTVQDLTVNSALHTMGLEEEGAIFQNQTFSPHVFKGKSDASNSRASLEKELIFADFYFVTELSKEKGSEFCAVRVRFVWDGNNKWSPFMLSWALSSSESILNGVMF